jgi:ArpU family phage transcriptional regulator
MPALEETSGYCQETRYLEDADAVDYLVYSELGMRERQYYRVKGDAFYKLAFTVRLEAYNEEETVG